MAAAANLSTPITLQGSDPNGQQLTFRLRGNPVHGKLTGIAPNLTYTPDLNYLGQDGFVFEVNDSFFFSNPATVKIDVKKGLLINNISILEGTIGKKPATFTVTMTVPGSDLDLVLVSYRTSDGTAKAGSDYVATSGTLIFGENTSQPLTVPILGDLLPESNETFLVQLFNASFNAVIVTANGRGTIVDDDSTLTTTRVGTAALEPENSIVEVREPVNLSLGWTHPVGWRHLDSVDLLISDNEGTVLRARWHQAANAFSLLSAAADKFLHIAEAGSPAQLETSVVTLHVADSTGGGPAGQTATIDFSLSFKPETAGRTFSVEAFAIDDASNQQGYESVGTVTVLPRAEGR